LERTIVAIDVGTTKVCTLVGRVAEDNILRVIGMGVVPSEGLRKGVITDVAQATRAIGESLRKAQRVSNHTITEAYVGVAGSHISSQNSRGVVAVGRGDRPIDRDDIDRAMDAAQAVPIPHNRRVIHSIPRDFIIDGQPGIKNPLGLMGFRLEVEAHIVTGAVTAIQNLVRCVEANNVAIADLILQPLASAEAVLTDDEKRMGVALVDIGGGTTDAAIYIEGSIWETLVQAVGGNHITHDIAVGLRTPFSIAEEAKIRYAHAIPTAVGERERIELAVFGAESLSSLSRRELCQIVASRTEEMLEWVAREIKRSGFDGLLPAGVVLTGGTAGLMGIRDVAVRALGLPVRIGMPRRLHGLVEAISSPAYATSVGLLLWGQREDLAAANPHGRPSDPGSWAEHLREWLSRLLPPRA
jgi:cell division protein FtsA